MHPKVLFTPPYTAKPCPHADETHVFQTQANILVSFLHIKALGPRRGLEKPERPLGLGSRDTFYPGEASRRRAGVIGTAASAY